MYVPGYTADASLYRSAHIYRASKRIELAQASAAVSRLTLAQLTGIDCIEACHAVGLSCLVACAWAGPGFPACAIACGVAEGVCLLQCPPDPADGGGGGGIPPQCPSGVCCELSDDGKHCRLCKPVHGECP
jgi:hypothetical protein